MKDPKRSKRSTTRRPSGEGSVTFGRTMVLLRRFHVAAGTMWTVLSYGMVLLPLFLAVLPRRVPAAATAFAPRVVRRDTTLVDQPHTTVYRSIQSLLHDASTTTTLSHDEIRRYARHLVLSDVGIRGQEALQRASVLVIGAGGLGSPALLYLAAAGVGHVGIVDADTVDTSNLQRQIIHSVDTVGWTKCQSARHQIRALNPHVQVRLYEEEFTSTTARRIVSDGFDESHAWNVVVDGSDNFPTKYLINDVCAMYGIPWVYAAILAFEGQVSVFNHGPQAPDYRDLLPTPPPPGDVPSCAEGGVLGVLPGTMGCLQATEAIKLILGHSEQGLLVGRVLVFDALTMTFSHVGVKRADGRQPVTELMDYQGFCGGPQTSPQMQPALPGQRTMDEAEVSKDADAASFHVISPRDCWDKLVQEDWAPWVMDVRLPTEHDICHLPFTDCVVPHRTVQARHVPATGDVLVYCKAGVRGAAACQTLVAAGVDTKRLYNLQGGILQWQKDIDPSLPRY